MLAHDVGDHPAAGADAHVTLVEVEDGHAVDEHRAVARLAAPPPAEVDGEDQPGRHDREDPRPLLAGRGGRSRPGRSRSSSPTISDPCDDLEVRARQPAAATASRYRTQSARRAARAMSSRAATRVTPRNAVSDDDDDDPEGIARLRQAAATGSPGTGYQRPTVPERAWHASSPGNQDRDGTRDDAHLEAAPPDGGHRRSRSAEAVRDSIVTSRMERRIDPAVEIARPQHQGCRAVERLERVGPAEDDQVEPAVGRIDRLARADPTRAPARQRSPRARGGRRSRSSRRRRRSGTAPARVA